MPGRSPRGAEGYAPSIGLGSHNPPETDYWFAESMTSRAKRRIAHLSFWAASVTAACVALCGGCNTGTGGETGPAPVVREVKVSELAPPRTDAGDPLGCCDFTLNVVYDLEAGETVGTGYVEFDDPRTNHVRVQSVPLDVNDSHAAVDPKGRNLTLRSSLPGVLVGRPGKFQFSVTLVTERNGISQPGRGELQLR